MFVTTPSPFTEMVTKAIEEVTGRKPHLSTSGGTSDARFITAHCPVVEFGLVGQTMHQVDERVPIADLRALTDDLSQDHRPLFRLNIRSTPPFNVCFPAQGGHA